MNLKKKLIIWLTSICAVPLMIFTTISVSNSIQTAKESAMSENLQRTELVQGKTNELINKNLAGLKLLAINPAVRSYAPDTKPLLADAVKIYPDLNPICVANSTGLQVFKNDNIPGTNISDRNFYKLAMGGQAEVVSEVLVSRDKGRLVSVLAVPINDTVSGKAMGVIEGVIELSVLNDFVKGLSTNDVTVYMLDRDGKLLAHPTKDMKRPDQRVDLSNYDFVKQGLAGHSGSAEVEMAGKKMLVSYMKNEKTGWLICTETPYWTVIDESISGAVKFLLLGVLLIVITGAIACTLANTSTKPILDLVTAANAIAGGNLTGQKLTIHSKDELGLLALAFNTMTDNLTQLIRKIQKNAEIVAASAEELTAGSEQSAQAASQVAASITAVALGAEQQRTVVTSTAKTTAHMSKNISLVASKANAVSAQSAQTAVTAKEGGEALQVAVSHMADLEATVNTSAGVVTRLGERSKEIGQIVNTISGIASQTNLLALNAAIEAARAGEQGRGFAVVAEEVRKLAEQSQMAAKQIEDLISGIQGETDKAVQAMDKGTSKVKLGTGIVKEAGTAFKNIVDMTAELSKQVNEISAAIQNTDSGSRQIVSAVQEITALADTVTNESQSVSAATEEQSASMHEVASLSENLANMALELSEAISKFRT